MQASKSDQRISQSCVSFSQSISQNYQFIIEQMQKKKLDFMSQCLKTFKELPHFFENFTKYSNKDSLLSAIDCSNKFVQLANISQDDSTNEAAIYGRFFCRLRELNYNLLNFYTHSQTYIFIRQLIGDVNVQILEYKPDSEHYRPLLRISNLIISAITNLAKSKHMKKQEMGQIFDKQTKFQQKKKQQQEHYKSYQYFKTNEQNEMKQKQRNASSQKQANSLLELFCLEPIDDIEDFCLKQYNSQSNMRLLTNDCLNRNSNISQLIKRYEDKFKNYLIRCEKKKSKQKQKQKDISILTTEENTESPAFKRRLVINGSQTINSKKFSPSTSPSKNQKTIEKAQSLFRFQDQKFRDDILSQIQVYRQKYYLRKVVIGVNQFKSNNKADSSIKMALNFGNSSFTHTNMNMTALKRNNIKPMTSKSNSRSESQRVKIIKSNRSYISGVTSIPLKKSII